MRNCLRIFWTDVISPIRDSQQQLAALLALVAAYITVKSGGLAALAGQAVVWSTWGSTLIVTIPIWGAINLFQAVAKTGGQEAAKGFWIGNKFVYHTPEPIGAVEWRPSDNGGAKPISLTHPQRDSVVHVTLDFYPPADRIRAGVVWVEGQMLSSQMMLPPGIAGAMGSRANNGKLWVVAESQPDTVPIIIRVYCHYFVIGMGGLDD